MKKVAIILYGPPGSGKGTQANLLAAKLSLIHFDTGRFCETLVHDPDLKNNKIVARERKLFDSGILMTPSFVLKEVSKQTQKISKAGWGIVYSGSPRTLYEAEGLLPVLEKLFSKKGIYVFVLNTPESVSLKRNGDRILCAVCKAPLLTAFYPSKNPKHCPICAGPFYRRTLDDKSIIRVRLKEYKDRTEPIFKLMKKKGYSINRINGTLPPFKVFNQILNKIKQD